LNSSFIFYKPYNVLSQFTREEEGQKCLADFINIEKNIYPVGRLDYDSEGLLFLTNDSILNKKLLSPSAHVSKTYFVQVEGNITLHDLSSLEKGGIEIKLPNKKLYKTLPCKASLLSHEKIKLIPEREPPIRHRLNIPTTWICLTIIEGKNRQVRKMCAKLGFPVLRLIRWSFHEWALEDMKVGDLKKVHFRENT
jgi:23S rRNA pseudouridine2457 synthase